ncbi:hypothetical protein DSM100685_1247 [Bifidobacterium avesanii]|nr:hypothetical protein DSM100685_1247 [Bifidobacterium avesanii]
MPDRLDRALRWCRTCTAFGVRMHPAAAFGLLLAALTDVTLCVRMGLPMEGMLDTVSIYLTAAGIAALWPRVGCCGLVLYAAVVGWLDLNGVQYAVLPVTGMWLAAFLLCSRVPWRRAVAIAVPVAGACAIADCGPYGVAALGNAARLTHMAGCALAVAAGVLASVGTALAARADAERDGLRDGERLRLMRRNSEFARILHDTVMNDLSVIAMTADVCLDGTSRETAVPGDEARYWAIVRDRSRAGWTALRGLLDRLRADEDDGSALAGNAAGFMTALRRECADFQSSLAAAGMVGESAVSGECHAIDASSAVETLSLIRQCRSNVLRHARGVGRRYALHVVIGERSVTVTQTNGMNAVANAHMVGERRGSGWLAAGHGLALHRQLLEHCGGTLECGPRDGQWELHAVIPLHPNLY